jgi:hypothetical protein
MWYVLHRYNAIGEIVLCPEDTFNLDAESQCGQLRTADGHDLLKFKIPLGPPVFDVTVMDLMTEKLDGAIQALESAIQLERRNRVYRDIEVRYFLRLANYKPNEATLQYLYSFVPHPGNLTVTTDWIRPVIITLAMAYKTAQNDVALAKVRGMLELLPLSDEDRKILRDHAGLDLSSGPQPAV